MYVLVLAAVGIAAVYLFMIMPRMTKRKQMELFMGQKWAHRGLHCVEKGIPENSMAAFKQAVKEGYGIELDVHMRSCSNAISAELPKRFPFFPPSCPILRGASLCLLR